MKIFCKDCDCEVYKVSYRPDNGDFIIYCNKCESTLFKTSIGNDEFFEMVNI